MVKISKDREISFRLNDRVAARILELADRQGKTRNQVIREAIANHLGDDNIASSTIQPEEPTNETFHRRCLAIERQQDELYDHINELHELLERNIITIDRIKPLLGQIRDTHA